MTDTKRVDELEVGDIVIPNGCKEVLIVSSVENKMTKTVYQVKFEGIDEISFLDYCEKLTYLGNNKKEEGTMITQKVDCSALYPYFDALAEEEVTFSHSKTTPVYVRQQLKNIHELFEGVLGLTLEEVKTLYFERKTKKQETTKTKKVKNLCIGDKIFLFLPYENYEGEETVTKLQEFSDTQIRIITEQGTEAILKKDKIVSLVD